MQERQEFLDHYFVFSDRHEYEPPKDYSRTNGLLEDIRQSYCDVDEQRRLDELTRPREMKTHEPGQPLELPSQRRTSTGDAAAAGAGPRDRGRRAAARRHRRARRSTSRRRARNVERIER